MNPTAPPKPAAILATPINVEESRAQRLQRQQARFRDRGGIFVPTNRSILLDILLGKASPLKKPRRSASVSPSRVDEQRSSVGDEVSKPALRRSPRKQPQKKVNIVTDEQLPVGSEVSKPNKATSSKDSKSRPQTKAPSKRTTKPRDGSALESRQAFPVVEDSVVDTNGNGCIIISHRPPTQKACQPMVNGSEKKPLEASKKTIPNSNGESEDDALPGKSKSKGKKASGTKPQGKVGHAKVSMAGGHRATTATGSSRRKRMVEPVYSELSEDGASRKPTKKASTKKVKKSVASLEKTISKTSLPQKGKGLSNLKQTAPNQLPDVLEEDQEYDSEKNGLPSNQSVKVSLVSARLVKSLNASEDDTEDDIPMVKSKSKSKATSSQGKPQGKEGAKRRFKPTNKAQSVYSELSEDDSAYQPTKKSSSKKLLEDNAACKPTKKSTTKKVKASVVEAERCEPSSNKKGKGELHAPCPLPDIPAEDEEGNLRKEDMVLSESSSNAVVHSKGKKRIIKSITHESDSQPCRKRIKSATTQPGIGPSFHKEPDSSSEVPLVTSKKRRRNPEDGESGGEEAVDKNTKRKKLSGQDESRRTSEIPVEEGSVKPVAKRPRKNKVTKPARKSRKQSFDNVTTASKRKENASMSKLSKRKVASSNSGPPKSVLQKIKDSLGAQVVDNESDPIDFLS